jgi:phosphoribosyl 1,2-cyclic phosphodiesterase
VTLKFTILGCGSSMGVPRVALGWGSCDPNNPKNRRRRCSLLVERTNSHGQHTRVLIDTSPDLRRSSCTSAAASTSISTSRRLAPCTPGSAIAS